MTASYGGDWEARKVSSYLFHMRLKTWQGFFWQVNTASKRVWRCRNGVFCQLGGSDELLHIKVEVTR